MGKRSGKKGAGRKKNADRRPAAVSQKAEVINIQDAGVVLSVNRFCDEARCDNDTIARRIKVANIQPVGKNARENRYRLADLLQCAYLLDDEGNLNPAGLDPFKRKAHFQAATEEVRYRAECGEFIAKLEVESDYATVFKAAARLRENLPDVLERDCGLTPAQIEIVQQLVDKMFEEFHRVLNRDEQEDAAGTEPSVG